MLRRHDIVASLARPSHGEPSRISLNHEGDRYIVDGKQRNEEGRRGIGGNGLQRPRTLPTPRKSKEETHTHDEFDILDDMIISLADLLEEKRVITQAEWEQRIKKRMKT